MHELAVGLAVLQQAQVAAPATQRLRPTAPPVGFDFVEIKAEVPNAVERTLGPLGFKDVPTEELGPRVPSRTSVLAA